MSILKVDMRIVSTFSDFVLPPWYLGLTFVSNTFWTKILKSSHSEAVEHNMDNTLFCNLDECNDRG